MKTAAATIKPRALVEAMPEYHPPLEARTALRLDFNENTFAPSPRVLERLLKTTSEGLTKYPEREPMEHLVAAHFGLAHDQVLLTNGVDEGIRLLCLAFLDPDDEALIATPTFFMYDVSVQLMSSHLVRVQADASLEFPFERFLAAITPKTRLIMVASPNNPTGMPVSREHLLALCAAAPRARRPRRRGLLSLSWRIHPRRPRRLPQPRRRPHLFEGLRPRKPPPRHVGRQPGGHALRPQGLLPLQRERPRPRRAPCRPRR